MNTFTKFAMTVYYFTVESFLKLLGYKRDRIFSLAKVLGFIRYHAGYIGEGKSKAEFLKEISKVFPEISEKERKTILKEFWIMHQKSFLDFFMAYRLEKENYHRFFEFKGDEYIDSALKGGKGGILTTFHYGDGRILHIGLALKGYPVNILSSKYEEYSKMGREVRLRTSRKFHKVYYEGESMRWIYKTLMNNELVFMSITAFAGPKGLFMDSMGSTIYVSTAPVRIALKTDSPIIPAVAIRADGGIVKIFVREPIQLERTGEYQKDLEINTQKLLTILEEFVHHYPGQHDWRVWFIRVREDQKLLNK